MTLIYANSRWLSTKLRFFALAKTLNQEKGINPKSFASPPGRWVEPISKRMATRAPTRARYWWVSPIDPKLNQWGHSSTNSKALQWCGWLRLLVVPGDLIVWVFQAFFVVPMSYECGAQLVGTILGFSRFNDIIIYKSVKTIAVRGVAP